VIKSLIAKAMPVGLLRFKMLKISILWFKAYELDGLC